MNLIVGGTGALGQALTQRLRAANQPVRVMTREPGRAAEMARWGVEVVQGDLLDEASLVRACNGATVVVAAAHRRRIDTARAAGVRHFVYTSAHADARRRARLTHVPVPALRLLSRLLRSWHPGLSQVMLAGVLADAGDQRFDCTPMTQRFGFEPTSLETFLAQRFQSQR